jgi:hemolysin III
MAQDGHNGLTGEIRRDVYGLVKPRLRGTIHAWTIVPFICAGVLLAIASDTAAARSGVVVYVVAITSMLTASACYHRLHVSDSTRAILRRVDHSMIGVAVAGTYTPVVVLVANGTTELVLLTLLWLGALGGLALTLFKPDAPRQVRAILYIALGWVGVSIIPNLVHKAGVAALVMVAIGGAFYSLGALVYGIRRPNPAPRTFGFHEVFHSLVVVAVVCHFVAIAIVVNRLA